MKVRIELKGPVDMSDHDFAAWVKERGWQGKVHKQPDSQHIGASQFLTEDDKILALVIYDNRESTHTIYLTK